MNTKQLIGHLRRLGRQRIIREQRANRLAELKQRRVTMAEDLEKMRHWPAKVQADLQEQIDGLDRLIAMMERRADEAK